MHVVLFRFESLLLRCRGKQMSLSPPSLFLSLPTSPRSKAACPLLSVVIVSCVYVCEQGGALTRARQVRSHRQTPSGLKTHVMRLTLQALLSTKVMPTELQ